MRASIDERTLDGAGLRKLERSSMQSLVEETVSILGEPKDLDPIAALTRENEERAALGIELEPFANSEGEVLARVLGVLETRRRSRTAFASSSAPSGRTCA